MPKISLYLRNMKELERAITARVKEIEAVSILLWSVAFPASIQKLSPTNFHRSAFHSSVML